HFQRDVVARDDVLRRTLERFLPKRNAHHAIDWAENQNYARALGRAHQAAEAEDHAALIFGQDLDGTQQVNDEDDDGNRDHRKPELHIRLQATCESLFTMFGESSVYERIVAQASGYRR